MINFKFNNDAEFQEFIEEIRRRLTNRNKSKTCKSGYRQSAVMILLMNKNNELHIFVTKRTNRVKSHKGEVSFPGGGIEDSDSSLLDTALRETFEETGIKSSDIDTLGEFDEYTTLTGYHVSSYIGVISYPYEYILESHEIEDYAEIPISCFTDRSSDYSFSYKEFYIWGLTAMIKSFTRDIIYKKYQ